MNKILTGVAIWLGINFLMNQFFNKPQATTQVRDADGNLVTVAANTQDIPAYLLRPAHLDEGAVYNHVPQRIAPIWPVDSQVDIVVVLSDTFVQRSIKKTPPQYVVLQEKEFRIGNYSDKRFIETTFKVPEAVQNNGTLWGHFFVGLSGSQLDPTESGFDPATAYHLAYPLTQYLPKKKVYKTRNLLDGLPEPDVAEDKEEELAGKGPIITNYYHPNTSLSFVPNTGVMDFPRQHPAVRQFVRLEATGARDGSGQNSWYCMFRVLFRGPRLNADNWQTPSSLSTLFGSCEARWSC